MVLMILFLNGCSGLVITDNQQILQETISNFAAKDKLEEFKNPPKETIVLKLPNEENWKEIYRCQKDDNANVLSVPINQAEADWDMIQIQYAQKSADEDISRLDVETILSQSTIIPSERNGKVVKLNIIDKSQDDIIYALSVYGKNDAQWHSVGRFFLRDNTYHNIQISKIGPVTNDEQQKQIVLLKDNVYIEPFGEALNTDGLSLVNIVNNSINLGENFQNWKLIHSYKSSNGYTIDSYLSPLQDVSIKESEITECLEVFTFPIGRLDKLRGNIAIEMNHLKEMFNELKITALENSPTEMIYSFHGSLNNGLMVSGVVRSFMTDHGYYSFHSKRMLNKILGKEKIDREVQLLKSIKTL